MSCSIWLLVKRDTPASMNDKAVCQNNAVLINRAVNSMPVMTQTVTFDMTLRPAQQLLVDITTLSHITWRALLYNTATLPTARCTPSKVSLPYGMGEADFIQVLQTECSINTVFIHHHTLNYY